MPVKITNDINNKRTGFYFGDEVVTFQVIKLIVFNDDIERQFQIEKQLSFSGVELKNIGIKVEKWIKSVLLIREENPFFNYFEEKVLDMKVSLSVKLSKTDRAISWLSSLHNYIQETLQKQVPLYIITVDE